MTTWRRSVQRSACRPCGRRCHGCAYAGLRRAEAWIEVWALKDRCIIIPVDDRPEEMLALILETIQGTTELITMSQSSLDNARLAKTGVVVFNIVVKDGELVIDSFGSTIG